MTHLTDTSSTAVDIIQVHRLDGIYNYSGRLHRDDLGKDILQPGSAVQEDVVIAGQTHALSPAANLHQSTKLTCIING